MNRATPLLLVLISLLGGAGQTTAGEGCEGAGWDYRTDAGTAYWFIVPDKCTTSPTGDISISLTVETGGVTYEHSETCAVGNACRVELRRPHPNIEWTNYYIRIAATGPDYNYQYLLAGGCLSYGVRAGCPGSLLPCDDWTFCEDNGIPNPPFPSLPIRPETP